MVHSARPPSTSHSSFLSSGASAAGNGIAVSGERKENVLKSGRRLGCLSSKLSERADTAHLAIGKQYDTVADALGVSELVNGQNEGAAVRDDSAQQPHNLSCLPDVEAVEGLVHQQHGMRRKERQPKHHATRKPL